MEDSSVTFEREIGFNFGVHILVIKTLISDAWLSVFGQEIVLENG